MPVAPTASQLVLEEGCLVSALRALAPFSSVETAWASLAEAGRVARLTAAGLEGARDRLAAKGQLLWTGPWGRPMPPGNPWQLRTPWGGAWSVPNWYALYLVCRSLSTEECQWVPDVCVYHVACNILGWERAALEEFVQGCLERAWLLREGPFLFATDETSDKFFAMAVIAEYGAST